MKVLAVDTTTSRGSAALADGDELLAEVRLTSEGGHSARLLPAIAFLLDGQGLRAADVEGYAVILGPGSFTGLRVGISTVQGLALASRRPCLGVSGLDVLARRMVGAAPCLVAMIDAFRDEVYACTYDGQARPFGPPAAAHPLAIVERLPAEPAAFLGDGVRRYRADIARARPDAIFPERSLFLAGTLARLAAPRLLAGEGGGPESLRPLYIRGAEIRKTGP